MHNIEKFVYPLNVDKKDAEKRINEYVARESDCGGLYNSIRWIDAAPCSDRAQAEKFIDHIDRGNYDCVAVQYVTSMPFTNAKLEELRAKEHERHNEFFKLCEAEYPKTLTSAMLGCKKCSSKLAIKYLKGNFCPVCKADLRPDYIMKKIDAAQKRWTEAQSRLTEYIDKHARKEVKWLVKIEYHS